MVVIAGIDVGKRSLEVSVAEGPVRRFHNTASGIHQLLSHLVEQGATGAVCEPTGGYERQLVRLLREARFPVQLAHPNRVGAFARVCGYEAKTDPLDAQVLARYGRMFPNPAPNRQNRSVRSCRTCCASVSNW